MVLYFQTWVSIAGILIALASAIVIYIAHKKVKDFTPFKNIPIVFLIFALSFIPLIYNFSNSPDCVSGFCSLAHNYGNIFALIIFMAMSIILIKISPSLLSKTREILIPGIIITLAIGISTLFIGVQIMEKPEVVAPTLNTFNLEGFLFVAIFLISLYFSIRVFMSLGVIEGINKYLGIGFLLIALSQIPATYHVFTTPDNLIHFILSGTFILLAILIFYHSVKPVIGQIKSNEEIKSKEGIE